MDRSHALILAGVSGCAGPGPQGEAAAGAALATEVVSAPGATGTGFFDAELAVNGVRGGGQAGGSLDVFTVRVDEELILGFTEPVHDVDGPDLAVFENPFDLQAGGRFFEPVVVEGSADCERFVPFPFDYLGDLSVWTGDPSEWSGFGGVTPVAFHEEDNPLDPLSEAAGGDRFDLADLDPDDPVAAEIRDLGLGCVRLTAASGWVDAQSGLPYPADPTSSGPDIDGVYAAPPDI